MKYFTKLYSITLPISPMIMTLAKKNEYTPKAEIVPIYLKPAENIIIIPRCSVFNPDVNKYLPDIGIAKTTGRDLPTEHEFCIDALGNQELIINHIMEKKFNAARIDAMVATALLQLGTGYGKTYVAAAVINKISKKTLWVLPNTSILEQTMDVLTGAFPDLRVGTWFDKNHSDPETHDIILAIIDSLLTISTDNIATTYKLVPHRLKNGQLKNKKEPVNYSADQFMDFFGLTVFDEVHKYTGPVVSGVFWHFSSPIVFAMSATVNENKNGLDNLYKMHFGEEIIAAEVPGFQKDELNWKGKTIVVRYQNPPEFSQIIKNPKTDCLSFLAMVNQFAEDQARNKLILDLIKEARTADHNIFVFCEFREHCAKLAQLYARTLATVNTLETIQIAQDDTALYINEAQTQTILLRGGATASEVDSARKTANVIFTTYSYTNVGVSITRMSCIIFATPRRNNMMQIIGRIERRGGDIEKERLVYDIVDDLTPLRAQYNSRKVVYKLKNYSIDTIQID